MRNGRKRKANTSRAVPWGGSQSANQISAHGQADWGFMQSSLKTLQKFPVEPSQNASLGQTHSKRSCSHKSFCLCSWANQLWQMGSRRVLPSVLADFDLMKRTFEKLFIPWQCRSSYRNKHRSINLGTAASIHYKSCQKSFISCKGCCVSLKNAGFNVRFGVRVWERVYVCTHIFTCTETLNPQE